MNKLRISTRLIILVGVLAALLIAVGGVGLMGIGRSNEALRTVYEDRTVPMAQIASIDRMLLRDQLTLANSLIDPVPEEVAKRMKDIEASLAAMDEVWKAYSSAHHTSEEDEAARKFADARSKFVKEGVIPAVEALNANDLEDAKRVLIDRVQPLFVPVREGIETLSKLQLAAAKAEYDAAVARYRSIRVVAISAIVAGVLFAVVLGVALIRGISRSLRAAIDSSNAVAQGDLSQPIRREGHDEVARLLAALSAMQSSLIGIVGAVRAGTDTIATASGQIAAGNQDLSSRTEQQASSLEQTAASMEELSSTVRQNADNARQANQLAVSASEVAARGGSVVGAGGRHHGIDQCLVAARSSTSSA